MFARDATETGAGATADGPTLVLGAGIGGGGRDTEGTVEAEGFVSGCSAEFDMPLTGGVSGPFDGDVAPCS
jgi:hypothetical protein